MLTSPVWMTWRSVSALALALSFGAPESLDPPALSSAEPNAAGAGSPTEAGAAESDDESEAEHPASSTPATAVAASAPASVRGPRREPSCVVEVVMQPTLGPADEPVQAFASIDAQR